MAKAKEKTLDPLPVMVVDPATKNPYEGKFPRWDEKPESRAYEFIHIQQPGQCMECSPKRTVLNNNGLPTNIEDKFCLEDGNIYELPVEYVKKWNKLYYTEQGVHRNRFSFVEVDV